MIRKAIAADAPGIGHVHITSWQETYRGIVPDPYLDSLSVVQRQAKWAEWLAQGANAFVAEVSGAVVGFVSGGRCQRPELGIDGELGAIYLLRSQQGKGLGLALFEAMRTSLRERGFKQMCLWVIPENPTVGFYTHMGGKRVGEDTFEIGGKQLTEHLYVWDLT